MVSLGQGAAQRQSGHVHVRILFCLQVVHNFVPQPRPAALLLELGVPLAPTLTAAAAAIAIATSATATAITLLRGAIAACVCVSKADVHLGVRVGQGKDDKDDEHDLKATHGGHAATAIVAAAVGAARGGVREATRAVKGKGGNDRHKGAATPRQDAHNRCHACCLQRALQGARLVANVPHQPHAQASCKATQDLCGKGFVCCRTRGVEECAKGDGVGCVLWTSLAAGSAPQR